MFLGQEVLEKESTDSELAAILGFYQAQGPLQTEPPSEASVQNVFSQEEDTPRTTTPVAGRIVVYGDSNCADNSHLQKGM